jgi:hypothetical protein
MDNLGLIREENMRDILNEMAMPNTRFYSFDWDDNILYMPTKIILKNKETNNLIEVSTGEFAEIRSNLEEMNLEFLPGEGSFKYFRPAGDNQFIQDSLLAETGPSWNDFVECINDGSIFAIITARGHTPEALKETVKQLIYEQKEGIEINELIDSLRNYKGLFGMEGNKSPEELIDEYLDLCKYYPVSYKPIAQQLSGKSGSMASPEELKILAMKEFVNHVKVMGGMVQSEIGGEINLGFSDDDIRNYNLMNNYLSKPQGVNPTLKYTGKNPITTKIDYTSNDLSDTLNTEEELYEENISLINYINKKIPTRYVEAKYNSDKSKIIVLFKENNKQISFTIPKKLSDNKYFNKDFVDKIRKNINLLLNETYNDDSLTNELKNIF